jgi:hypothetical protein
VSVNGIDINVFPDGGTRIESYYKDGTLAKLTGTAAHPARYTNSIELESSTNRFFIQEFRLDASGNDTRKVSVNGIDILLAKLRMNMTKPLTDTFQ